MITRIYKILVKAFFISSCLFSQGTDKSAINPFPVELLIYEGYQSLLLNWSFNDSIVPQKIIINARKSSDQEFYLVKELKPDINKFLDNSCDSGERYFYIVEIEDFFGNLYSSDSQYPVFGTCQEFEDTFNYDSSVTDVKTMILKEIVLAGSILSPGLDIESVLSLFNLKTFSEALWIENFPINEMSNFYLHFDLIEKILYESDFSDKILEKELVYRNQLYLSPQEWNNKIKDEIEKIKSDWAKILEAYEKSLSIISKIPPLFVSAVFPNEDESKRVKIQVNDIMQQYSNIEETYLLYEDEFLGLTISDKDSLGIMFLDIPKHWNHFDLISNGSFLQRVPLWFADPIINTIEGDLIPADSALSLKLKADSLSAWFNELIWSPTSLKLQLEVAGAPEFDDYYAFSLNDMFIWEPGWDLSYETQFIDSTFILDEDLTLPIVLSWNKWEEGGWSPVEYMILDTLPLLINRFPDGGKWSQLANNSTLGATNNPLAQNIDQELIPEFFVLYQNYPNPFNGLTRLTFDLLEDSMVSFYVTDATGRVRERFLNNQFINSGAYNFDWNGENYSTGIYFFTIQVQSGNYAPAIMSRKMIYLK